MNNLEDTSDTPINMLNFTDADVLINEINNGNIKNGATLPFSSADRSKIHEAAKNMKLLTKTVSCVGITNKIIHISFNDPINSSINKSNNESINEQNEEFILNIDIVEMFIKYSRVPLPTNNPKYVSYYLKLFEKYCKVKYWEIFINDVKTHNFLNVKNEINKVKRNIIDYIRNNEEYKMFNSNLPNLRSSILQNTKIYSANNINKTLLSIDVISANYTFLVQKCPSFDDKWDDFIRKFTTYESLIQSKYLREVIFGELENKTIMKGAINLIYEVNEMVQNNDCFNDFKKITCSTDELIYEIPENYDLTEFENKMKTIDADKKIYRIEKFKLFQFRPYNFFVKEIINEDGTITPNLKGVPKAYSAQCIKRYQNECITELDLKTMIDGIDATYDECLQFT